MKKNFLFLLFIMSVLSLSASSKNYTFKRLSTHDGLSNNWVRCFHQDELGFIWIGTSDGLNRYDGATFKTYRPVSKNGIIVGNVTVNDIFQKDKENLWIATDMGLYSLSIPNEEMKLDTLLPPFPILSIQYDDNEYWLGTDNGLFNYNEQTKEIVHYTIDDGLPHNYVNTITIDSEKKIWVGTKNGLAVFSKNTQKFTTFRNSNNPNSISGNNITKIIEDHYHTMWVGTAMNGLNVVEKNGTEFNFKVVVDGTIQDLLIDKHKELWIAHAIQKGIQILNIEKYHNGEINTINLTNDLLQNNSLSDNAIFSFFEDRQEDIWIGTFGNGINFYSYKLQPFKNIFENGKKEIILQNSIVNVFFEEEDYLWIGTEGGLDCFNKKNHKTDHFGYEKGNPRSLASNPVLSIYKDSRGNLWVGTWAGGLHKYNYETNDFMRYLPSDNPGAISNVNIFSIFEDSKNNLWIGTNGGGLNLFDYKTETFKAYTNIPSDTTSLSLESINYIYETQNGELYISLYSELDKYNYNSDDFLRINRYEDPQREPGNINFIHQDSHQNIWIATNIGIERYDKDLNFIKIYTSNDGLPSNTIQAMFEDDNQNLWLSSNNGICCFAIPDTSINEIIVHNFSMYDGLSANDFKARSAFKNKKGVMYFGSSNGYVYFHPDSILLNEEEPKIVFTGFLLQKTRPNKYSSFIPLKTNLNLTKRIDLYYPDTDFSITFASLNFLNSEKNQYKYKLEGYDTKWIDAGNSTSATYTNIDEGVYTFMVKGSNNDGIWCKEPISIQIEIHPPWWKSRNFKLFVWFFLLFSSITFVSIKIHSLRRENKELEARVEKRTNELSRLNILLEEKQEKIVEQNKELGIHRTELEKRVENRTIELEAAKKKAEESDRLKSAFLANMSHEIRTPMNAIIGFSTMLAERDLPTDKKIKYIEQIKTNGNNLNVLINDIIDISIIEAQQLVLSKTEFSVSKILNELFQLYELENKGRFDFYYNNINSPIDLIIYNDAVRFRQIMVNLLSNSFKYSDTGKIEFGYDAFDSVVQFYVKDNGIGINEEEIDKIFKLFYKTDKDKRKLYRGTGIGLAITKNLVEIMGGKIWLESKLGVGTAFYFTLPIK